MTAVGMTTKAEHPTHVFHYTTTYGCRQIVETQVLFASNIEYLNDRKELRFFDQFIRGTVRDRFRGLLDEISGPGRPLRHPNLDSFADEHAKKFIDVLHRVSRKVSPTFVCSFCRAADDFVERNGLLSQWRGYGAQGGVALRFDVKGLNMIRESEVQKYLYAQAFLGDVIYGDKDPEFPELKGDLSKFALPLPELVEQSLREVGIEWKFEGERGAIDDLWMPYSTIAPRLKHPGFQEEREYRVVFAPAIELNEKEIPKEKEKKHIKFVERDNYLLPYIEINQAKEYRLPIDLVVVGPSREQERRRNSIELLMRANGYAVEVISSEIPFA